MTFSEIWTPLRKWATLLWALAMLALAIYGIWQYPGDIARMASHLHLIQIAVAFVLIVVGKLLIIALVWFTLLASNEDRGLFYAWHAYSFADITKYLPGGIWSIAGRIVIYKNAGIEYRKGIRILFIETALIIAFSTLTGLSAFAIAGWTLSQSQVLLIVAGALLASLVAVWTALLRMRANMKFLACAALVLAWVAFGSSFAVIYGGGFWRFIESAGWFNVGFAAGQLAIFAPSGLGVREAVVAVLSVDEPRFVAELVLVHRLVWIVADFAVFAPAAVLHMRKVLRDGSDTGGHRL